MCFSTDLIPRPTSFNSFEPCKDKSCKKKHFIYETMRIHIERNCFIIQEVTKDKLNYTVEGVNFFKKTEHLQTRDDVRYNRFTGESECFVTRSTIEHTLSQKGSVVVRKALIKQERERYDRLRMLILLAIPSTNLSRDIFVVILKYAKRPTKEILLRVLNS